MEHSRRVYLEPTVWYQLANYTASEFKVRAEELFRLVAQGGYAIYVSDILLEEINHNTPAYRRRTEELLHKHRPVVILHNPEVDVLAEAYMENAFKGRRHHEVLADAYHAAVATASGITYMASYNYRNLLNVRILEQINAVNLIAGYNRQLAVLPPFMFLDLSHYEGEKGGVHDTVWTIKAACGRKLEQLLAKKVAKRDEHFRSLATNAGKLGLETVRLSAL
jgi:hypothetical protein